MLDLLVSVGVSAVVSLVVTVVYFSWSNGIPLSTCVRWLIN